MPGAFRGEQVLGELSTSEMKTPGDAAGRQLAGRKTVGEVDVSAPARTSVQIRLVDGAEADCRAGVNLAREAHLHMVFRDIPFSEEKAKAIYAKAVVQPERFGLIYAVPAADELLAEDGLLGFASVQVSEHFLGIGTQIATVQTLNVSQELSGTLLDGKVALRLVQAVRHWAKTRNFTHLVVHVTNGDNAEDADRFFLRCGIVTVGENYVG
ncbi:hypothetical protein [Labrenzia sp. 011]|uniref:hypothetical protein n=1 Tax=Labrenzia sp. 011 TaxID=2171494 RepID=UPI000D50B7EB|nr:hypothetical protein [Labrenzia sp. 011]PVB60999.1 hypothetical protein DCO57_13690 [Labrenzia sp. 011]